MIAPWSLLLLLGAPPVGLEVGAQVGLGALLTPYDSPERGEGRNGGLCLTAMLVYRTGAILAPWLEVSHQELFEQLWRVDRGTTPFVAQGSLSALSVMGGAEADAGVMRLALGIGTHRLAHSTDVGNGELSPVRMGLGYLARLEVPLVGKGPLSLSAIVRLSIIADADLVVASFGLGGYLNLTGAARETSQAPRP